MSTAVLPSSTPSPAAGAAESAGELAARHGLLPPSRRPSLAQYLRALWLRRHFVWAYARARITATYASTRLGPVWNLLTPLLTIAVFYLVFGLLLHRTEGTGESYLGFLATGVFVFQYTRDAFRVGVRAVSDRLGLIRALHFPRAVLPLAIVAEQAFILLASLTVTLLLLLGQGEIPSARWLLLVPAVALQTMFNCGAALAMARVGAVSRDTRELVPWILRVWMYTSGVMYSIAAHVKHAPHAVKVLMEANPAAVYIELVRHAVLDGYGQLTPHVWLYGAAWAVLSPVLGFMWFWKAEHRYGRG
ncbi:ABC transporter permease [Streptacidiphilus monticola]|uniref:Transport permease protein n=1 Tax=Streptacidiphilus monticola TaxID=2161674 RepID=A0ABW1G6P6_9ACTN